MLLLSGELLSNGLLSSNLHSGELLSNDLLSNDLLSGDFLSGGRRRLFLISKKITRSAYRPSAPQVEIKNSNFFELEKNTRSVRTRLPVAHTSRKMGNGLRL
jgi:hypothetical protein